MATDTTPPPWHAAFPPPRNENPGSISREELLQRFKSGEQAGVDFLLVDLRRLDHEGGTIRGSLNMPAQSLYHSLPTLYALCQKAHIRSVVWFCGSSRGRGTRAAGLFDDLLNEQNETSIRSVTLSGGIKGWVSAGPDYQAYMNEYEEDVWKV